MRAVALCLALCAGVAVAALPTSVVLRGAAVPGTVFPVMGLGTAGGGSDHGFGAYGECWASCGDGNCSVPLPAGADDCGRYTEAAIAVWAQLGGRRYDSANSYRNQNAVGRGIRMLQAPRSEIFFQSKTGPGGKLGYNETLDQVRQLLNSTGLDYADNVMLHWPSCESGGGCQSSTDPACDWGAPTYDDAGCRVSSYRGLIAAMDAGLIRSAGVSNFNISHLQDLAAAGLPPPALNQISFSLYHSASEMALVRYCAERGIVVNSWCPFSRPDSWTQQPPCAPTPLTDPTAVALAAKYGVSSAALQMAWQVTLGVLPNPRSQNAAHMLENMAYADIAIDEEDMAALAAVPQSLCQPPACTNPVAPGQYAQTCVNNGK